MSDIPKHIDLPKYHNCPNHDIWVEMNAIRMALDFILDPTLGEKLKNNGKGLLKPDSIQGGKTHPKIVILS